jgi:ABC-type amino acid transport substrate-binding protein
MVFERVRRSNTLRVGYLVEPPYLNKQTRSGRLSGIYYDFTNEIGARLGLRVEWVEEVNLATLSEGLESGRYDLVAFPLWRNAIRSKSVYFSHPLLYTPVGAYVRSSDHRFDKSLGAINDPTIRVASMDGELAGEIAKESFPRAHLVSLPQMSDYNQLLLEVQSNKADVTFFTKVLGDRYIRANPDSLKEITGDQPIRVYGETLILPLGDERFKSMIDATVDELIDNGALSKIFADNGERYESYYRPALPYRQPVTQ